MDAKPLGDEAAPALLAAVVNSSQDAIISKTLDGIITSWNPAAEQLFGYAAGEAIGQHISLIIPPDRLDEERQILQNIRAGRRIELREVRRVTKDGRLLWISLVASPIQDASGRVIGASKVARDITAEKQLRSSVDSGHRLLKSIVDNVPALISFVDRDYRYRMHNRGYETLFRLDASQIDGHHVREVVGETMFATMKPRMDAALAGESISFEHDFPYPDGMRRSNVTYVPQTGDDGVVSGFAVLVTDVSQRHLIAEQLQRSDEAQRLLVALHDATRGLLDPAEVMWRIVSLVGRHFRVSRCTFADVESDQEHVVVTRDYTDGVVSGSGRHRLNDFGPLLARDLKAGITVVIPDTSLDERTCGEAQRPAYTALQIRSALGTSLVRNGVMHSVLVLHHLEPRLWSEHEVQLFTQVAERTWYALDSARAHAALRESQEVLSLAMRGGRMGVWWRRMNDNRVWWSDEIHELFGLAPGTFEGTEQAFFDRVHPEDRAAISQALKAAIETRSDYTVPFRFKHASGEWRWMDGRGRAAFDAQGRSTMLYGIGIDITESRRAVEALRDADQRKTEFLAVLAHELRNPLAPIRNAVQYMQLKGSGDADVKAAEQVIDRQATHLARLVDDLLDISRISSGKIELQKERISLSMVLTNAIEAVRPMIQAHRHDFALEVPQFPVFLEADSIRLAQVVQNLLGNAAKYTPPGGRLVLAASVDRRNLHLRVADNGIGIPADMLSRVFEIFTQVDRSLERSSGGLGIGLTLVKRLVELHGGSVQARSDGPGCGSEFLVVMPIVAPNLAIVQAPEAELHGALGNALSILVVDDNIDAADTMSMTLSMLGHRLRAAHDGAEAIRAVRESRPEVMLLDIGLPKMNGYDVAREVRKLPGGQEILLIALTGWGQDADRQQSQDAGFDHHLVKPVDFKALLKLVEDLSTSRPKAA